MQTNHDYLQFAYDLDTKTYVVIGMTADTKHVLIPTVFNDGMSGVRVVSSVAWGALANTSIEKVTIPSGMKSIDPYAFENCLKLKEVKIREGLKVIHSGAFKNCRALETINIPKSVKKVSKNAFDGCFMLRRSADPVVREVVAKKEK